MTHQQLLDAFTDSTVYKLTGPAEHWLTTFNTSFWGLEEKYRNTWGRLVSGDVCVFHSSRTQYLASEPAVTPGVIGVGIVAKRSEKSTQEWIAEMKTELRWPLLIHFMPIWWFGATESITDEPIRSKRIHHTTAFKAFVPFRHRKVPPLESASYEDRDRKVPECRTRKLVLSGSC